MTRYYIQRSTNTHGDVFAVAGLAHLIDSEEEHAMIYNHGPAFAVEGRDLTHEDSRFNPLIYRYLKVDDKTKPPAGIPYYDFKERDEAEQAKRDARKEKRASNDPEARSRIAELTADPEHYLFRAFKNMQTHKAANKILETISGEQKEDHLAMMRKSLQAMTAPDYSELPELKLEATGNQLVLPLSAKGIYALKPSGTSRGNPTLDSLNDSDFLQYLRYAGYFDCAVPFESGDGLRLQVPIPHEISFGNLQMVAAELRKTLHWGTKAKKIKLDILAALGVTRILVEHSEFAAEQDRRFEFLGKKPSQIISALYVGYYVKTSQFGRNITELNTIAVPGWFHVNSKEDVDLWKEVLDEHQQIIRNLDETHSDEITLLLEYRQALQLQERQALFQLITFMADYGAFWMSATSNPKRQYVPRFATTTMERMVKSMATDILPILQNPGFQAVSRAIRKSTVSAQAQKAMGQKPWREVRYGLIAEINRKRFDKRELVETISLFVAQYNSENARQREVKNSIEAAPANVTTEELESLARLIDETQDPALVGSLLCAYGTCREPYEQESPVQSDNSAENSENEEVC